MAVREMVAAAASQRTELAPGDCSHILFRNVTLPLASERGAFHVSFILATLWYPCFMFGMQTGEQENAFSHEQT